MNDVSVIPQHPRVSIGLPTFNSRGSIRKTIDSILSQSYPNLEIIISDNCSTDDTHEICCQLSKNCEAIKYFRQPKNIGLMPNFEFVLKHASGDFFMWISDDDTLEPGILIQYVDFLITHSEYSLVSGQILYWFGERPLFFEKNFNMAENSRTLRAIQYYLKVVHGAMFYGLMQRELALKIPLRNRIGEDWHFVASLAYLGKVRNLDCVGYNKRLGGLSRDFKTYAGVVEASWFSADFPRIKIACDAFSDILFQSPLYKHKPIHIRFILAIACWSSIVFKYLYKEFPFIVGGKLKRLLLRQPRTHVGQLSNPLESGHSYK